MHEHVEIRVNPDCIEIVSDPGPDASIRIETLNSDKIVARRYRNRRIGEFLKELELTEGRCTGIRTLSQFSTKFTQISEIQKFHIQETYFRFEEEAFRITLIASSSRRNRSESSIGGA